MGRITTQLVRFSAGVAEFDRGSSRAPICYCLRTICQRDDPSMNTHVVVTGILALFVVAFATTASAQVSGCGGMNTAGKGYKCCVSVVTKNPSIAQCDKEVAVFRCVGNKKSKYVSANGCAMPKL
jgi:hypothetical protein